jgi:hypothetical protein
MLWLDDPTRCRHCGGKLRTTYVTTSDEGSEAVLVCTECGEQS